LHRLQRPRRPRLHRPRGQVDIVAWAGYIERGETDKAYDWVTQFEQDTGCKVNVKVAGTSDEMVSLMTQGGYDLVTASGDASLRLIRGGTVQPVDITRIPGYASVDERCARRRGTTWTASTTARAYQWGPNVLMYSTAVFKEAPASWSVVFEDRSCPTARATRAACRPTTADLHRRRCHVPDGEEAGAGYQGPVRAQRGAVRRRARAAAPAAPAGAALLARRQRAGAGLHLRGHRGLGSWPFQVNTLVAGKQPVASTVPAEGATGWADTTMLASDAKHPNCAYKWMEWSLSAKVQGDVAAWFGSVPAVPAACTGNALLGDAGCATNGFDKFDKITSGGRRSPPAPRAPACPTAAGRRISSR